MNQAQNFLLNKTPPPRIINYRTYFNCLNNFVDKIYSMMKVAHYVMLGRSMDAPSLVKIPTVMNPPFLEAGSHRAAGILTDSQSL